MASTDHYAAMDLRKILDRFQVLPLSHAKAVRGALGEMRGSQFGTGHKGDWNEDAMARAVGKGNLNIIPSGLKPSFLASKRSCGNVTKAHSHYCNVSNPLFFSWPSTLPGSPWKPLSRSKRKRPEKKQPFLPHMQLQGVPRRRDPVVFTKKTAVI